MPKPGAAVTTAEPPGEACMNLYIHIWIYIQKERERERDKSREREIKTERRLGGGEGSGERQRKGDEMREGYKGSKKAGACVYIEDIIDGRAGCTSFPTYIGRIWHAVASTKAAKGREGRDKRTRGVVIVAAYSGTRAVGRGIAGGTGRRIGSAGRGVARCGEGAC